MIPAASAATTYRTGLPWDDENVCHRISSLEKKPDSPGIPAIANVATNIVAKVNGGNLELTWPVDHTGWRLQVQTNSLNTGLGTNWVTVPDSTSTNQMFVPMDPANGSVFFRLVYP